MSLDLTGRKLIFKCRTGSHLYGLATPESDTDYFGVFLPSAEDMLGMNRFDQQIEMDSKKVERNTKDDVDCTYFSLPKYLYLLLKNNPNIVETLFVNEENTITLTEEFKYLQDNFEKIISQKVYVTFGGYAQSQKKKLEVKAQRYKGLVEVVEYIETFYRSNEYLQT